MDTERQTKFDIAKRKAELKQSSLDIGLTEDYISTLVETFYGRIRAHEALGPIFDNGISSDWDHHLEKMKAFWRSIALYDGSYTGKPVPAHQRLRGVSPDHFASWLQLFEQTLADTAPNEEAATYLLARAETIAQSLQLAMFGSPGVPATVGPVIGFATSKASEAS